MKSEITIKAGGKVNTSLMLGKKRSDGYHDIQSVMQSVALADQLTVRISDNDSFHLSGPYSNLPAGVNIVEKALGILRDHYAVRVPLDLELVKNIPFGAGLAGGSSDAFAAIRAFDKLFEIGIEEKDYLNFAARLGSDVPFFYYEGRVLSQGRGEILTPLLDLDLQIVIIVKPSFIISTAEAYKAWDDSFIAAADQLIPWHNDFESVLFPIYPVLEQIKLKLLEIGAEHALLTGSGSCVCGYFNDFDKAVSAMENEELAVLGKLILTRTAGRYE